MARTRPKTLIAHVLSHRPLRLFPELDSKRAVGVIDGSNRVSAQIGRPHVRDTSTRQSIHALDRWLEKLHHVARHELPADRASIDIAAENRPRVGVKAADRAQRIDRISMNEDESRVRKHVENRFDEEGVSRILENESFAMRSLCVCQLELPLVVPIRDARILREEPLDVAAYPILNVQLRCAKHVREHPAAFIGLKGVHRVNRLDARRQDVSHLQESRERTLCSSWTFGPWRRVEALPVGEGTVVRIFAEESM